MFNRSNLRFKDGISVGLISIKGLIFTSRIQQDLLYRWNNSKTYLPGKIQALWQSEIFYG